MIQDTVSAVQDSVVVASDAGSTFAGVVIAVVGLAVVAFVVKLLFFTKSTPSPWVGGGGDGTPEGPGDGGVEASGNNRASSYGGGVGGTVTEF